jgi:hypothetical protein
MSVVTNAVVVTSVGVSGRVVAGANQDVFFCYFLFLPHHLIMMMRLVVAPIIGLLFPMFYVVPPFFAFRAFLMVCSAAFY